MLARVLVALATVAISAEALAAPCPADLPVLFIVQDKSGSMSDPPTPSCTTCASKWDSSKAAVGALTSQFSNRFRFGLQMYPHDSTTFNCTTGTTVSAMPATSAQIAAAYAAKAPGGGTPTAVSLSAAKTYLTGLRLSEPAYVLLITDGLPNCNLNLNPGTCQATTPGCANDACGLGAKDCLDDSGSRSAAAALLNAGFKVYVVGFGASATANNNKAVLDGIASAGGTTRAYAANDQASLNAALSAVAYDATTCCKDVCTRGASQCTSTGEVRKCELDASIGCTNWVTTACPAKATCTNGSCVSCTDACTLNATRCSGSSAQKCVAGATGCTEWKTVDTCTYAEVCASGTCQSCEKCSAGQTRCTGNDVETCERDLLTGCTDWYRSTCPRGAVCQAGACQSCTGACTAGAQRCNGATPQTCAADARGCTAWTSGTPCTDFCSGGACGSCGTTCTIGESRCNGRSVETCVRDANGCSTWSANGDCAPGDFCLNGRCQSCAVQCEAGTKRCAGSIENSTVEECRPQGDGCNTWVAAGRCAADEKCSGGTCIPPCHDECVLDQGRCDEQGSPEACVLAPTGCTVWTSRPACDTNARCVDGTCYDRCIGGEIETCPEGFVCTGTPQGKVCIPVTPSDEEPVVLDPTPTDDGEDPKELNDDASALAASGCGCSAGSSGGAFALFLAPLVLGALRRRRR